MAGVPQQGAEGGAVGGRCLPINFRRKATARTSIKVFVNVRVRGRRHPKQLHLGYISLRQPAIPAGARKRIERALRDHWQQIYGHDLVEVDWELAERRYTERRASWLELEQATRLVVSKPSSAL